MSLRLTLIGHPVNHSLSPPMHRAAFLSLHCSGTYDLTDVEANCFPSAVEELVKQGLSGWNVTVPHKERMYEFLLARLAGATLTPEACLVGAVNTVRIDSQGRLHGHNTDMPGFLTCVGKHVEHHLHHQHTAVLMGAGGVARACIAALIQLGYKQVFILARDVEKARKLTKELENRCDAGNKQCQIRAISFDEGPPDQNFQLLVNCTAIGLTSMDTPPGFQVALAQLKANAGFFIDTVYRRDGETLLCGLAREAAVPHCDGRSMLVEQAVLAFEFWSGRRPGSDLLEKAIENV